MVLLAIMQVNVAAYLERIKGLSANRVTRKLLKQSSSVARAANSCLFKVSQNHRMVGVGRDLCGLSSPTPLPKQGHLWQSQNHRSLALDIEQTF